MLHATDTADAAGLLTRLGVDRTEFEDGQLEVRSPITGEPISSNVFFSGMPSEAAGPVADSVTPTPSLACSVRVRRRATSSREGASSPQAMSGIQKVKPRWRWRGLSAHC